MVMVTLGQVVEKIEELAAVVAVLSDNNDFKIRDAIEKINQARGFLNRWVDAQRALENRFNPYHPEFSPEKHVCQGHESHEAIEERLEKLETAMFSYGTPEPQVDELRRRINATERRLGGVWEKLAEIESDLQTALEKATHKTHNNPPSDTPPGYTLMTHSECTNLRADRGDFDRDGQ